MEKVIVKMILVVVWTSRCVCVDTIVKVILMFTNHDPKLNLFQMFTLNTSHVQQQLDYGKRKGYSHLVLAMKNDDPSDAQIVSNLDMRVALQYLQRKVNNFSNHDKIWKQHTKINLGGGGGRKKQEQLD